MSSEPPLRRPLLALCLLAPVPSLGAACALYLVPGDAGTAIWVASKAVLYSFPALWHFLVDRRPFSTSPLRRGGMAAGWLTGFLFAAVILGGWHLVGKGTFDPSGLREVAAEKGFDTVPKFLAIAAWVSFLNSLAEEYVFRWFLLSRARAVLAAAPAVAVASLIFAAHHVVVVWAYFGPLAAWLTGLGTFAAGVIWCVLTLRYGSVRPAWASHVVADVAMMAVGFEVLFG
jgi:membrane protease YdiL (CAAX protease family)